MFRLEYYRAQGKEESFGVGFWQQEPLLLSSVYFSRGSNRVRNAEKLKYTIKMGRNKVSLSQRICHCLQSQVMQHGI